MPDKTKPNFWLDLLDQIVDVFFKSSRRNSQGKTWHQHVVPHEKGWAVRREGNKRITSSHRKQVTAIRKATTIAKRHKADVIIHRESGGIRDRVSYRE